MTPTPFPNGHEITGGHDTYKLGVQFGRWKNMYHATALSTQEHVLLKSRPMNSIDTLRVARERHAAEKLLAGHPHLVLAQDYSESDGLHWLVYPYIDGEDLYKTILKGDTATPDRAGIVVDAVCDGLSKVHAADIIHRDVKSSNILLTRPSVVSQGYTQAKLCDFDLSYHADLEHLEAARWALSSYNEHPWRFVGTPHYIAPEIWLGQKASVASDIYAFGVTLYETLTRRPPFDGNANDLRVKHLADLPRRPNIIKPSIPRSIADVVMHALEKDPAKRFSCAEEFKKEYGKALR